MHPPLGTLQVSDFTGKERRSCTERNVRRGEGRCQESYKEALEKTLPADIRAVEEPSNTRAYA